MVRWVVWMSLPIAQLKLQNSSVVQGNRYEKLGMGMMLSMLADRKLKYHVILKSKCLPKEKLCDGVKFTCNGKSWVAEELMVQWQEVWDR
jgi:hypothetical protein